MTTGGRRSRGEIVRTQPNKPLISIITVVYNRASQLEATILSVVNQGYQNIEYIIMDGGSSDGTVEIIKKYDDRIDLWESEPDRGIYHAMNKAIDRSTGEWINFMNCGDRLETEAISRMFEGKRYHVDIIYGDAMVEYPTFQTTWKKTALTDMWKRTPFCHQACFVQASLMKEFKFNERFNLSSDFDFLYKAYLSGKRFVYVSEIICFYDYTDGISIQQESRSLTERKQAVLQHGFSVEKWFYYTAISVYIRFVTVVKRIIGKSATGWLTRFLKQ